MISKLHELTYNQQVWGSSPQGIAIKYKGLAKNMLSLLFFWGNAGETLFPMSTQ